MYGLIGAGAVSASLIGRLPGKSRALGPVAGVSFRVASRIANTLKAGRAVRSADELNEARVILFHAPEDQTCALLDLLKSAQVHWAGKSLIFCDCEPLNAAVAHFRAAGASVASVRGCAVPGRMVIEGHAPALTFAHRMARELRVKSIEITPGCSNVFEAAMTMGSGALTPLIDRTAELLRHSGLRDAEAVEIAAALFEKTVLDYAHSGKQSWSWYIREPNPEHIRAQIEAGGDDLRLLLLKLILFGFERFEKHANVAEAVCPNEALSVPGRAP